MSKKFSTIDKSLFDSMQIEAGIICRNFNPANPESFDPQNVICATTGGITASCKPTFIDLGSDVDNCPENTKELKRIQKWDCSFGFTALNADENSLKYNLGCADVGEDGKITPRHEVKQEDFEDIWFIGDRVDGGMIAIELMNGLSTDGLSLKTSKNGKGNMSATITGHSSIEDPNKVPMSFYSSEPSLDSVG